VQKAEAYRDLLDKQLGSDKAIKQAFAPPHAATSMSPLAVLVVLSCVSWALQGGVHAPVMDCDETYNYLEPLHYTTHGTGMQTWEYSPAFRLRSWLYVEAHAIPVRLVQLVLPGNPPFVQLVALRVCLHCVSVLFEARLCDAMEARFGRGCGLLCAVLLGLSPGMSHARRALLPSSTCMLGYTIALAEWLRGDAPVRCLLAGAMAVLFAWPFAAPAFVPMGLHVLATHGLRPVLAAAALGLLLFGATSAAVDSWYYGRAFTWSLLETMLYNAFGASGAFCLRDGRVSPPLTPRRRRRALVRRGAVDLLPQKPRAQFQPRLCIGGAARPSGAGAGAVQHGAAGVHAGSLLRAAAQGGTLPLRRVPVFLRRRGLRACQTFPARAAGRLCCLLRGTVRVEAPSAGAARGAFHRPRGQRRAARADAVHRPRVVPLPVFLRSGRRRRARVDAVRVQRPTATALCAVARRLCLNASTHERPQPFRA